MQNVVGTLACIAFLYCPHAKIKIGMSITTIRQVGCDKAVPVDKLPRKVHVMGGNTLKVDSCNWALPFWGLKLLLPTCRDFLPEIGFTHPSTFPHAFLDVELLTFES